MDLIKIILSGIAILFIIATLISYFKFRKNSKNKLSKIAVKKDMSIFTFCSITAIILSIFAIIINIVFQDNYATLINLDINPSIELKLNQAGNVISATALNGDAKKVVDDTLNGKGFEEAMKLILDNLIKEDYAHHGEELNIILYAEGEMKINDVHAKIIESCNSKEIRANVIAIDNVTKEDVEFAKKNSIGIGKASYINSVIEENSNIISENLIDKSVNEIVETKLTGKYCEKDYTLEGDFCIKELRREPARSGKVCPSGYYLYNGKCYEETKPIITDEYECPEHMTLVGNKCAFVEEIEAIANFKCEKGNLIKREHAQYRKYRDNGDANEYLCEDKSNAKAPTLRCLLNSGHIMINGNCYNGPAPLINGGCPNGDTPRNGWCYSKDDGDQWQCPNGDIYEKSKNTYVELCPDTFKYTKATGSYSCPDGYTLNKNVCKITRYDDAQVKKACPSGYTFANKDRCIDMKNVKTLVDGYVCENDSSRVEDNTCVILDIVEVKHN